MLDSLGKGVHGQAAIRPGFLRSMFRDDLNRESQADLNPEAGALTSPPGASRAVSEALNPGS
jgi:hypothetical protein